jgi:uncharacterized SAM-binding protein YcdF (DUF218 family)
MLASHEWERLPATATVARRYPDALVLLTFPPEVTAYNCHRCLERIDWLALEGVHPDRVRSLAGAANTYDEAVAARRAAMRDGFTRLLVVTSPYHTRRALGTFHRVFSGTGVDVGIVPASPAQGEPERWWRTAYDRYYVRYEWAALLVYWWKYGVPAGVLAIARLSGRSSSRTPTRPWQRTPRPVRGEATRRH